MNPPRSFVLVFLLVFLAVATAAGDNSRHSVNLADLPATVRKTVLEQKQKGAILRLEKTSQDAREIYEVQFKNGELTKTVFIAAGGAILQVKQPVLLSKISRAARKTIESSVADGKIISLESVQLPPGFIAAYEVKFQRNGAERFLRLAPDGTLSPE
jgi:hypothetical protein